MSIKLYNTFSRNKEVFEPIENGIVKFYTCGPTVYNYAHVGNFRAYMFEDILRRTLKYYGYKVVQVMNLTDVDDKTIRDSRASKLSLNEFTLKYKKAFFEDLKNLKIEPAEFYPAATEHIPEMIKLIEILFAKGYAYKSDDNSIYFSIQKFKEYGQLAKIDMSNQRSGVRINSDEYEKDSVADFALWKAWSESDGDVSWESPWGKGRPGWHIECSAMSMKYLGETFDIHTGGIDNMFPHHEDEIAQSEAATGKKFVNYWLHCEHLLVNNEKMSKSLGNFYTLRDLISKGYSYAEIRWVLISAHYRKKLNFTFDSCLRARDTLKSFDLFFTRLNDIIESGAVGESIKDKIDTYEKQFAEAMFDDLNISEALGALFSLQKDVNILITSNSLSSKSAAMVIDTFKKFNNILSVFKFEETAVPEEIKAFAEERLTARKNKDFSKSDELRNKIKELGWLIEDTQGGYRLVKN